MRGRAQDVSSRPDEADSVGHHPLFLTVSLALVTGSTVAHALDPTGIGDPLFFVTIVVLLAAIGLGPLLRGARPLRAWVAIPAGAACLILALLTRASPVTFGALTLADVFYFAGYLCFGVWFVVLNRHLGRQTAERALLDSAAGVVGMSLGLWTFANLNTHATIEAAAAWAIYPILDVVVLFLAGHLAIRVGQSVRAWWWVFGALVLQLVLDTLYAVGQLALSPTDQHSALTTPFLFVYYGLALGATHPSVVALSQTTGRPRRRFRPRGWNVLFLLLAVLPAMFSLVMPVHDERDRIVRSVMVTGLLALMFGRLLMAMHDLTRAEADSAHRASHDALTGLLNRGALYALVEERLASVQHPDAVGILLLDCDDFKQVNDTWGHHAGDRLLRAIASGLPRILGPDDVLARHGGDEFVVVTTVRTPECAANLAAEVETFFERPIPILPERAHLLTPSIGVTISRPGQSPDALITQADIALYEAKERGGAQTAVFDTELAERTRTKGELGTGLRAAIRDEAITIAMQPLVGGDAFGELIGWEALARWHDDVHGQIPPDVFIPLAEHLDLIDALGDLVLRTACRELAVLRRTTPASTAIVSVNVSPIQLRNPHFAESVDAALAAAGLPGDALWLEVTETHLVERGGAMIALLEELRGKGVRITLDDFGTGYAALATLLGLPLDIVKLDKSLVDTLASDSDRPGLIPGLLALMAGAGIDLVVAEGVETREQAEALDRMGCPMAQGWHFGRPTAPEHIRSALAAVTP